MTHSDDFIRVHGARENNLKNINVETPKRGLTVFTGVSGVLPRFRRDRGRVAAADQQDVQRFRTGLHGEAAASRRGRARGADHRDQIDQQAAEGRRLRTTIGTATAPTRTRCCASFSAGSPQVPGVLVQQPLGPRRRVTRLRLSNTWKEVNSHALHGGFQHRLDVRSGVIAGRDRARWSAGERGSLLQEQIRPRLHGEACEHRQDDRRLGARISRTSATSSSRIALSRQRRSSSRTSEWPISSTRAVYRST
jgi:hypothetical protein